VSTLRTYWRWLSQPFAMWHLHHLSEEEKALLREGMRNNGRIECNSVEQEAALQKLRRNNIVR
jgi:hypothetical protein